MILLMILPTGEDLVVCAFRLPLVRNHMLALEAKSGHLSFSVGDNIIVAGIESARSRSDSGFPAMAPEAATPETSHENQGWNVQR